MTDYFKENGYLFVWWGWRLGQLNTKLVGFWTAHKDGCNYHSMVMGMGRDPHPYRKDENGNCYVHQIGPYSRGYEFNSDTSTYFDDAAERGAIDFSQVELDKAFASEKEMALQRLKDWIAVNA